VPTIVPVRPALPVDPSTRVRLDLNELNESQFRQGPDGWHAVLSLRGVEHRIWFKEAPIIAAAYTVELPLDRDFEFRAAAGTRLWRGLNGRPQGAPPHAISAYRRRRIARALRASDASTDGATYREIAEVPNVFPSGNGQRTNCGIRSSAWSRPDSLWCRAATALC
jgi:Uncharacterized conserved protein (DUF2285)